MINYTKIKQKYVLWETDVDSTFVLGCMYIPQTIGFQTYTEYNFRTMFMSLIRRVVGKFCY